MFSLRRNKNNNSSRQIFIHAFHTIQPSILGFNLSFLCAMNFTRFRLWRLKTMIKRSGRTKKIIYLFFPAFCLSISSFSLLPPCFSLHIHTLFTKWQHPAVHNIVSPLLSLAFPFSFVQLFIPHFFFLFAMPITHKKRHIFR